MIRLVHGETGLDLCDLDNNTVTFDSLGEAYEAQETFNEYEVVST